MDKETLSKYGWVVIVIIVLVILMSFAAPFGQYFSDSTMAILNSLSKSAGINVQLKPDGTIIKTDSEGNVITDYTPLEIQANERLYPIGKTNPYYVVAEFNEDYTEVVITKNGTNSDGLMTDWDENTNSPMREYNEILEYAEIKKGVRTIGNYAFGGYPYPSYSKLEFVKLPEGLSSIGDYSFEHCSQIRHLDIPNSVTSIGEYAFKNCHGLNGITIPNSVTTIDRGAFMHCIGLTQIAIPNSVLNFEPSVFSECWDLKNAALGNNITSLDFTFNYCSSLKNVFIPKSITLIKYGTFDVATYSADMNVENIYYAGTQEDWEKIVIEANNNAISSAKIHFNSSYSMINSTCTEVGNFTFNCSCCESLIEIVPTPTSGHNSRSFLIEEIPATCTQKPAKIMSEYCYRCNKEVDRKTVTTGYAKGHNYGDYKTILEATCTEDGKEQRACLDCGFTQTRTISATGHSLNNDSICITCGYNEKLAQAEAFVNDIKPSVVELTNTYNISYYSAILVLLCEGSQESITLAQQGDNYIEEYVNVNFGPTFVEVTKNPEIDTVDEYFMTNMGVTIHQIAYYIEKGNWPA